MRSSPRSRPRTRVDLHTILEMVGSPLRLPEVIEERGALHPLGTIITGGREKSGSTKIHRSTDGVSEARHCSSRQIRPAGVYHRARPFRHRVDCSLPPPFLRDWDPRFTPLPWFRVRPEPDNMFDDPGGTNERAAVNRRPPFTPNLSVVRAQQHLELGWERHRRNRSPQRSKSLLVDRPPEISPERRRQGRKLQLDPPKSICHPGTTIIHASIHSSSRRSRQPLLTSPRPHRNYQTRSTGNALTGTGPSVGVHRRGTARFHCCRAHRSKGRALTPAQCQVPAFGRRAISVGCATRPTRTCEHRSSRAGALPRR